MAINLEKEDWRILERWLEDPTFVHWVNQSDTKSVSIWENHFNLHPEHWELAKVGKALISGIPFRDIPVNKLDGQEALASLLGQLENDRKLDSKTLFGSSKRGSRTWLVAASLAILMVASAGVYWQFFYNPGILLATQFGEQLQTSLPDGSVVTLNANSHLRYRKQDPRKVWLDGEAYFEIEKKPETGAQFLVITPDLQVTVLGTSFNVNTRNDATKVFLQEGKVMLDVADPATGLIEMSPGDLIIYSQDHKELQEHRKDASALQTASWKEGALIFKDKLLTDALFDIEDIYGIQFIIKTDDLLRETITGGVPIRDLQVTLNTLSEVYGIEMKAVGKRYFITGRH